MNHATPIGTVELLVKDQYGRQTYHPVNAAAHHFAAIAGTKTLTLQAIRYVLALGFEVTYVHAPINHPTRRTPTCTQ